MVARRRVLPILVATLAVVSATLTAQTIHVGVEASAAGSVPVTETRTLVNTEGAANLPGIVTKAYFGWSASDCPGAVKIKFFRPAAPKGRPPATFVTERGPFDVGSTPLPGSPRSTPLFSVTLDPPVQLERGDWIGITNLTTCGGPLYVEAPWGAISMPGDVTAGFAPGGSARLAPPVVLFANRPSDGS